MDNPAPVDRDVVLSPEWLTKALQPSFGDVRIGGVSVIEEMTTLATKVRLALEYSNASPAAPGSVFVKGFFGEGGAARAWIGEPEARFYAELSPGLNFRKPRALYSAVDPSNSHGLVILNDLVPEGAQFLTALSPYTTDQVESTLAELAKLHAQSWDSPKLEDPWLEPKVSSFIDYISVEKLQGLLDGERGTPLPQSVRSADRLRAAVRMAFARTEGDRRCLVHGDAHAGNLYLDSGGSPGIVDWQIVRRGHWSFDVAYHIAAALDTADRERSERDLVREYLTRMKAHGLDMPGDDDAWRMYQLALVYGYNLWAVTTTVDPEVTHEFVRRLGLAVAANDSLDQLGV